MFAAVMAMPPAAGAQPATGGITGTIADPQGRPVPVFPLLVLSGAGIASGRTMGHVRNVDVAPTIAALLGVALPGVEGRELREAVAARPTIRR
jgi:hypothetical protein